MKKIVCALLVLAMMLSLAACGGAAEPKTDNVITVWAWDEAFNIKAVNDAAELYKSINPDVTIEVVNMAQEDIVQKLNTSLASSTYEGLPEVVLIEDYRIQGYLRSFPDDFADLTSIAKPEDFAAFKTAVNVIDGKLYGIPFDSGVAAIFYRLDVLEQAGYSEADMQDLTWEEFIKIGEDVKAATGMNLMSMDPSDVGQLRMMLQSAGSWYTDPDGKVTVAGNQVMEDAINTYIDLYTSDVVVDHVGWDKWLAGFHNGEVWTVPTGCWISASVIAAEEQSGNWRVAPFPSMGRDANSVNASSCGGSGWYILKNVGDTDAALDFMKHTFASSVELMDTLAESINLVSTLNAGAEAEYYSKGHEFYGGQEIFRVLAELQQNVPAVNYGKDTYLIEDKVTEAIHAILGGADMTATLADYQAQLEASIR